MPTSASIDTTRAVITSDRNTVATVVDRSRVLTVAAMGPQGPEGARGLPGPAGGSAIERVASGPIGGHRLVRSLGASLVGYVDAASAGHGDDTLGVTTSAAVDGATVLVQVAGPVEFNGWAWTPGIPVFAGLNGLLTQTPPSAGFIQPIGHAESPTILFLAIEPAIYLGV